MILDDQRQWPALLLDVEHWSPLNHTSFPDASTPIVMITVMKIAASFDTSTSQNEENRMYLVDPDNDLLSQLSNQPMPNDLKIISCKDENEMLTQCLEYFQIQALPCIDADSFSIEIIRQRIKVLEVSVYSDVLALLRTEGNFKK